MSASSARESKGGTKSDVHPTLNHKPSSPQTLNTNLLSPHWLLVARSGLQTAPVTLRLIDIMAVVIVLT